MCWRPRPAHVLSRYFVPEDNLRRRAERDRGPYDLWTQQGFIEATRQCRRLWRDRAAHFGRQCPVPGARDRRRPRTATHIALRLQDEGATIVEFRQGFRSMAAPTRELEKLIVSKKLAHDGKPVTRWMAANVAVAQDPAGNLKPAKDKPPSGSMASSPSSWPSAAPSSPRRAAARVLAVLCLKRGARNLRAATSLTELVPAERDMSTNRRHRAPLFTPGHRRSARAQPSPWPSTSPPLTDLLRASQGQIGRDGAPSPPDAACRRRSVPRCHRDAQGVARVIAAAAAAGLPLEVEQPGVRRPAVLQQPGVDVGPSSAGGQVATVTCHARRSSRRMA